MLAYGLAALGLTQPTVWLPRRSRLAAAPIAPLPPTSRWSGPTRRPWCVR